MNVLYVARARTRLKPLKRMGRLIKGTTDGQEGFFEASLFEAARVTPISLETFLEGPVKSYDAIVVNARCGIDWKAPQPLMDRLKSLPGAKALFLHYAHPKVMFGDAVLDAFDVIFKREPYRDRERYDISPANRAKIVPTHLSNPFLKTSIKWPHRNRNKPLRRYGWQVEKRFDVGFLGSLGGVKIQDRLNVWERIVAEDIPRVGGLIGIRKFEVPAHLRAAKLGKPEYLERVMETSVNLALNGHGPFTYRHLELLWAGAFVLSKGDIRDQELRAPLVEDQDYAAFDTLDEMIDKIRFYAANATAREDIARNGRRAYERLHDVAAHATEIRQALAAA